MFLPKQAMPAIRTDKPQAPEKPQGVSPSDCCGSGKCCVGACIPFINQCAGVCVPNIGQC
jgi:hypothetical protein